MRKMLANLQKLTLATLVYLEFDWVKIMVNDIRFTKYSLKFFPARTLHYTRYGYSYIAISLRDQNCASSDLHITELVEGTEVALLYASLSRYSMDSIYTCH